jgi:cysteine-rich repeat protein
MGEKVVVQRILGCLCVGGSLLVAGCGGRSGLRSFDESESAFTNGGSPSQTGSGRGASQNSGGRPAGGPGISGGMAAGSGAPSSGGATCGACQDCGDATVDPGEQCDDGNRASGDGCSTECQWEPVAISCGLGGTCALGANGVVKCWGANQGCLGLGDTESRGDDANEMGVNLPSVALGTGRSAVAIFSGLNNCAKLDDGSLKCWGRGFNGTLGLGDIAVRGDEPGEMGDHLPAVDLGTKVEVTSASIGDSTACAALRGGGVKCWGTNVRGSLGLGDEMNRGDLPGQMGDLLPMVDLGRGRKAQAVATTQWFACALLSDGAVKCWGDNRNGMLGIGDAVSRGAHLGEMGDALPAVDLGANQKAISIAVGASHVCALLDAGRLKCWGANNEGQLGMGDMDFRGDEPHEMGDNLPFLDLGTVPRAISVSTKGSFTCALFEGGGIKCWGRNYEGQLGLGDYRDRGLSVDDLGDNLPFVDLGLNRTARAICTGFAHACALLNDGKVKCWGGSGNGELGLGDTGIGFPSSRGGSPNQMGDNLPSVDLVF